MIFSLLSKEDYWQMPIGSTRELSFPRVVFMCPSCPYPLFPSENQGTAVPFAQIPAVRSQGQLSPETTGRPLMESSVKASALERED